MPGNNTNLNITQWILLPQNEYLAQDLLIPQPQSSYYQTTMSVNAAPFKVNNYAALPAHYCYHNSIW